MAGSLWNLLFFVITLGVLITIHEYGHFWVARRCGIKVLKFSIGFGKPLYRWRDRLGTEYVIAAIPLGGFVRMLDGRVDEVAPSERQYAFDSKPVLQRIAVVSAGPLANLLLAVVAYWIVFVGGISAVHPVVGSVAPDSIAEQAGVESGMQITAIDGRETPDWESINLALVAKIGDPTLAMELKDFDSSYRKQVQLPLAGWQFDPEHDVSFRSLGIAPYLPKVTQELVMVGEGSAAAQAGLQVGDRLLSVDGVEQRQWQDTVARIQQSPDSPLLIEVERRGQRLQIEVTPHAREVDGQRQGYLGVAPKVEPWPEAYRFELAYGPIEALGKAVDKTGQLISLSFSMIGKLITGDVSVKNLSGPISIAKGAGASAAVGFVYFLGFVALISVNLGIINLLPLPVLDGGHLLYYFIELLTGKPVPEKIQEVGFRVGSMLLMVLMGIALFNDFTRL